MFLILIEVAIAETRKNDSQEPEILQVAIALQDGHSDSLFWSMFFFYNLCCTGPTLPLYFAASVAAPIEAMTSKLANGECCQLIYLVLYRGFGTVLQVPLVRCFALG